MQCRVCGAPMTSGVNTCRFCGTAANPQGYGGQYQQADPAAYTQQYQQVDQTAYNQQYQQAGQQQYNQQYQQAGQQQYNQQAGQQQYNQQASQQQYNQQYQQAGPPAYNQQVGQQQYNQLAGQQSYSQQPGPASYQQYQQPGPASYQQADQVPSSQHPDSAFYKRPSGKPSYPARPGQQPAKKTSWGLLIGIVSLVVILGVVSALIITSTLKPSTSTSPSANTKPAPTSTASTPVSTASTPTTADATTPTVASTNTPSTAPSGNHIDAQASSIVTSLQTSNAIDSKTYEPPAGSTTSTFKVNAPIYVQFHLDATKFGSSTGSNYVNVRFYADSKSILQDDPLQIKQYVTVGYFEAKYYSATQAGAAEIYWCHTANCSDGKLAQVVHFTVTN